MIEVLKLALAYIEANAETRDEHEIADGLRQAIAELESQEPVGWIDSKGNMVCVKINESCRPLYTHPPQRTEPKVCCQQYDTCLEPCTPRGMHLAQRTWQGLTDEDVKEVERWVEFKEEGSGRIPTGKLVLYIEAKLKEKNNVGA